MILETLLDLRYLPRLLPELRSGWGPGYHPSQHRNWWGSTESATGLDVDEWTSLSNTPLFAGLNLIAGTMSCLTFQVDTIHADGKFDRDEEHWLWQLLHEEPNPETTAEIFVYSQYLNKLLFGDRYAEIERDAEGRPRHLWQLTSSRVSPHRVFKRLGGGITEVADEATPEDRRRGGEILYEVRDGGSSVWLNRLEMFHVPGFTLSGIRGNSLVSMHKETIAIGLALQGSAASIFGNASQPLVVIERPKEADGLDPDGVRARLAAWEAALKGVHRRGRATVAQEGETVKTLDLKLHELEFLGHLKHNVPEVARLLNIDAYWLGHDGSSNTYANVEHRWIDLGRRTCLPHLKADKGEIWRKLVPETEARTLRVRYNMKELLEPDSQVRSMIQQRYMEMGVETADSVSRQEGARGVPSAEGGDVRWIGASMRPLDQALAPPRPPALPPAAAPPPDEDDGAARASLYRERLVGMLEAAIGRGVRLEASEIRRAVEKSAPGGLDALLAGVDEVYDRTLPRTMAELVRPALGDDAPAFARRYAAGHRAELRRRLADRDQAAVLTLLEDWQSTTARAEAMREIERLTGGETR